MRMGTLRSVVLAWSLLLVLGAARPARAQHGTTGWAVMPMDPRSSVLFEVQTAAFDLPGRSGVWQTFSPRVEYAFVPWFSVAARPVLAHVAYDDGGAAAFGLSDTELVLKARVWQHPNKRASMSVGLSGELPTGDSEEGTGNGHVSLFPFITFSSTPIRGLMIHAMVGDRGVVAGEEHVSGSGSEHAHHGGDHTDQGAAPAGHGSVIMPHGEHELSAHAGACIMLSEFVLSPGIEWMQTFAPAEETELTAQLELALVPRRDLRLAVGVDLPLLEDSRFDWRGRLMAAWLF